MGYAKFQDHGASSKKIFKPYIYSQTCIRETPFGKSKLSVIHRCLSYQGSVRILVLKKSFTQ